MAKKKFCSRGNLKKLAEAWARPLQQLITKRCYCCKALQPG